jgi:hypothetical protein
MPITNGYATLAQVKAALRIPSADTVDDALLEMAIESGSRAIDGYANRNFYNNGTAVRVFTPSDSFVTEIDDLISLTTLKTMTDDDSTFDTTWTATDLQLEPLNGRADGLTSPYTSIRAVGDYLFSQFEQEATVQVTGVWGWSATPIAVTQATVIQSSRIYKRLDSPLGVAGFGDIGIMRVSSRLDPDVAQLVDPLRRIRFA